MIPNPLDRAATALRERFDVRGAVLTVLVSSGAEGLRGIGHPIPAYALGLLALTYYHYRTCDPE